MSKDEKEQVGAYGFILLQKQIEAFGDRIRSLEGAMSEVVNFINASQTSRVREPQAQQTSPSVPEGFVKSEPVPEPEKKPMLGGLFGRK